MPSLALAGLLPLLLTTPQDTEEEVRFAGGGVTLAGTLILPEGEGPHPVLAFTHGSGPTSRKNERYRAFVRNFVGAGVGVLIYSKRGIDESGGEYIEAPDLIQPCADLLGAIAFLREHPRVDPGRLGVWGASQGGWVAPLAASLSEAIRFVCVVSAPGVSPLEQNLYDKGLRLEAEGLDEAAVELATAYRRAFWGYLITGEGFEEARDLHELASGEAWFTRERFSIPFAPREELIRAPSLRHFGAHNGYEPRLALERVNVPTLAIFGELDRTVPVDASIAAFRSAFRTSGRTDLLTIEVFADADHNVRVEREGHSREHAPGYVDGMVDWVTRQAFGD